MIVDLREESSISSQLRSAGWVRKAAFQTRNSKQNLNTMNRDSRGIRMHTVVESSLAKKSWIKTRIEKVARRSSQRSVRERVLNWKITVKLELDADQGGGAVKISRIDRKLKSKQHKSGSAVGQNVYGDWLSRTRHTRTHARTLDFHFLPFGISGKRTLDAERQTDHHTGFNRLQTKKRFFHFRACSSCSVRACYIAISRKIDSISELFFEL